MILVVLLSFHLRDKRHKQCSGSPHLALPQDHSATPDIHIPNCEMWGTDDQTISRLGCPLLV